MCEAVFAFGQRGGYYFESPSKWKYGMLPDGLKALYDNEKVSRAYFVTLGAGDSYFISYAGSDGFDYMASSGMPSRLKTWLYAKDSVTRKLSRNIPGLRITLGPNNNSHFATDGFSYNWYNLPPALDKALDNRRRLDGSWMPAEEPRIVVLGACSNYLMVTEKNGGSWVLNGYEEIETTVEGLCKRQNGFAIVQDIILNPHRLNNAILLSTSGIVLCTNVFPHAEAALASIIQAIQADTEAAQKEQTRNGLAIPMTSTPNSLRSANRQAQLLLLQQQRPRQQPNQARRFNELHLANQMGQIVTLLASISVETVLGRF